MNDEEIEVLHPIQPRKAREQAASYLGFMAGVRFDIGDDETWELPNPSFLDPETKARYLEHQRFMAEDLDTKTEEFENEVTGKKKSVTRLLFPYRHGGKLINEEELLCISLMGELTYKKFLAAGGVPGQVQVHWMQMDRQLQERMKRDSKSS